MSACPTSLRPGEPEELRLAAQLAKTAEAFAISTARLVLRPWARQDLNRLVKLGNNYAVAKNLSTFPHPYSMRDAEEWFEMQQTSFLYPAKVGGTLAIALDGEAIGGIGIHPERMEHAELGYWLGEPYWGKGYATEAAAALIAYAFTEGGLSALSAGHYWDNHASGRVLTKLGFRYTVETNRFCKARGQEVRCLDMALPYERWAGKQGAKGE
jgi:[ribosomal protein S5]-alanine N-acetyltransferase